MSSPDKGMPNTGSKKESIQVTIGGLNPDRWQEYKNLRLQALEEEPVAFEEPIRGRLRLMNLQEGEWRAMLDGRTDERTRSKKIILCANVDEKLVGTVGAEVSHIAGDTKATIQNIFITKMIRGQEIGKKLMQAILVELKNNNDVEQVELYVYGTQQVAINLYKSLGFEVVDIIKNAKEHEGHKIDGYFLVKKLDKINRNNI